MDSVNGFYASYRFVLTILSDRYKISFSNKFIDAVSPDVVPYIVQFHPI